MFGSSFKNTWQCYLSKWQTMTIGMVMQKDTVAVILMKAIGETETVINISGGTAIVITQEVMLASGIDGDQGLGQGHAKEQVGEGMEVNTMTDDTKTALTEALAEPEIMNTKKREGKETPGTMKVKETKE